MTKSIVNPNHSIHFGEEAWGALNNILTLEDWSQIFILTDEVCHELCYPSFLKNIGDQGIHLICIPQGELSKSIEWAKVLWNEMAQNNGDRKSLVINLGGGMVSDIGGFTASTFMRGIDYINIPTTLLAMVDASIGGKTGVDLGPLKNQIGVVKESKGIFIITEFLKTLPEREFISGWMEMVKHGFISNVSYLEDCLSIPKLDHSKIDELIRGSVIIKNEIVSKDLWENGRRKTLNFGHTLGHAIESFCLDYRPKGYIQHGEAVGIGMILALYLSSIYQDFPLEKAIYYKKKINQRLPYFSFDFNDQKNIMSYLIHDKKNSHGRIKFVLLRDIGDSVIDCEVSSKSIFDAFDFWQKRS